MMSAGRDASRDDLQLVSSQLPPQHGEGTEFPDHVPCLLTLALAPCFIVYPSRRSTVRQTLQNWEFESTAIIGVWRCYYYRTQSAPWITVSRSGPSTAVQRQCLVGLLAEQSSQPAQNLSSSPRSRASACLPAHPRISRRSAADAIAWDPSRVFACPGWEFI
jgi:hypothetical protein